MEHTAARHSTAAAAVERLPAVCRPSARSEKKERERARENSLGWGGSSSSQQQRAREVALSSLSLYLALPRGLRRAQERKGRRAVYSCYWTEKEHEREREGKGARDCHRVTRCRATVENRASTPVCTWRPTLRVICLSLAVVCKSCRAPIARVCASLIDARVRACSSTGRSTIRRPTAEIFACAGRLDVQRLLLWQPHTCPTSPTTIPLPLTVTTDRTGCIHTGCSFENLAPTPHRRSRRRPFASCVYFTVGTREKRTESEERSTAVPRGEKQSVRTFSTSTTLVVSSSS